MATSVRRCIASASTVVSVTPSATTASYSGPAGIELADVDAAERERGEAGVDGVGHVVAVDAVVALVGDVHHVPVGPETARAVVAGPAQHRLGELLVADALEVLRFRVFGCGPLGRGQAVGEEPLRPVVGDPHGHAVGPDAAGVVVGGVEGVLGEQFAAREVVGEERCPRGRPAPTSSPRPTRCRAHRCCPRRARTRAPRAAPRPPGGRRRAVAAAVGDPDDRAVGPEAAGRAVSVSASSNSRS